MEPYVKTFFVVQTLLNTAGVLSPVLPGATVPQQGLITGVGKKKNVTHPGIITRKIKGSKDHSFEKPEKDVTVFYGRDRGEKGSMTSKWGNRDKVKFDSGEEYAYIYNMKEKKWYYKSRYSNPRDWTELR